MTLYKGVDAAWPGNIMPTGTQILAAYVGEVSDPGAPDTPHVWTTDEWNAYITAFPELRLLPIYVHNFSGDSAQDAANAVNAVRELGWAPNIGRIIVVDLETFVDRPYAQAINADIRNLGFRMMGYGSYSFIMQNGPFDAGVWAATLTKYQPTTLPPGVNGIQWRFGTSWDDDVFNQFVYDNCGVGLRHAAT